MAEIETAALATFTDLRQALLAASEWIFVFYDGIQHHDVSISTGFRRTGFLSALKDAWSSAPLTFEEKKVLLSFIKHYIIRIQGENGTNVVTTYIEHPQPYPTAHRRTYPASARISLGNEYNGLFAVVDYLSKSITLEH
jgi:hypothetical protein